MSMWTYVSGTIQVHVEGRTQPEIEYVLKTVLEHLPKVTGSEEDMKVYINRRDGYSMSSHWDEFGHRSNLGTGYYGSFEIQNIYFLTVDGTLRDRTFEETLKEFSKWLTRLSRRIWVRDVLVEVSGDSQTYLFTNHNDCYSDLCDVNDELGSWTDYLYWKPDTDNKGYPLAGKPIS